MRAHRSRMLLAGLIALAIAAMGLLSARFMRGPGGPGRAASIARAPVSLLAPEPDHDQRPPTATVEGIVLDPNGKPVSGATVVLARGSVHNGPPMVNRTPAVTSTTREGRFRFADVAAGPYSVTAGAEGLAPGQNGPFDVADVAVTSIEVRLGRGGLLLDGRVLDVGGGPVARARVRATDFGARLGGAVYAPSIYQVVADDSGAYRMWLSKGMYWLRAEADGYAPGHDTVAMGRSQTHDLHLAPAARIVGRVIERGSRHPVPDAELWLVAHVSGSSRPFDVKSDGEGVFAFDGVEAGSYRVGVRKGALVGLGAPVVVAAAQTVTDVVVEVDPGCSVVGRVLTGSGKPIEGARLSLGKKMSPPERGHFARSRTDGTFRMEGAFPGTYRLAATADGYTPLDRDLRITGDVKDLDLVLSSEAVISGRVIGSDGQPVEKAEVSVRVDGKGPGKSTDILSAVSNVDGGFEVKPLTAGLATVTGRHPEHGIATLPVDTLAPAERKTVLLKLAPGASVSGTVRLHDRTPVAGAGIEAQVSGGSPGRWSDSTGADGRYKIGPLPAGRVIIVASRSGGSMWSTDDRPDQKTVTVAAGEQKADVDLEVAGGKSIRGAVAGFDGKPVAGAEVTCGIERNGEAWRAASRDRAFTDADGAFSLDDLGAGQYTVWAIHPGYADAEAKGVSSGTTGLWLRFPAESTLAGVAVSSNGKAITDYVVSLVPGPPPGEAPDQRRRRQMAGGSDTPTDRVHDPRGAFEFRRLRGGSYELRLSTADGRSGNLVTSLREGERRTDARIVVADGVRLVGRVVEFDTGVALYDIEVLASLVGGNQTDTRTDRAGVFALEGLSPGQAVRVSFTGDQTTHVWDARELDVPTGRSVVDLGTIKLLRGNADQAWRDGRQQGMVGIAPGGGAPTRVRSLMPASPAERAGIRPGDAIVSIDDKDVRELGLGSIMHLLRGSPGSRVTIGLQSPGSAPRSVTVVRFVPPGNH